MSPQSLPDGAAGGALTLGVLPDANDYLRMLNNQGMMAHHGAIADDTRTRIELDRKLQAITDFLILWKKHRNSLAHVNRLPTEVLTSIFLILADLDPPVRAALTSGKSMESVLYKRLGWIRVTHVCASWRQQALTYSGLWKNVASGFTPQWMVEVVCRSRFVPFIFNLSIVNNAQWKRVRHVVEMVLTSELSLRVRGFRVKVPLAYMDTLLKMFGPSMPLLDDLELRACLDAHVRPGAVPSISLTKSVSQVRHLALENCMPSSSRMPKFCSLTSLEMVNTRNTTLNRITIPDCLEMLSNSLQLQSAVLKNIFDLEGSNYYNGLPISLARLSKLSLTCAIPGLVQMLRSLQIPVTSRLEIGFSDSRGDLSALLDLLELLVPFSGVRSSQPGRNLCDKLTITSCNPKGLSYGMWRIAWTGQGLDYMKLSIEHEHLEHGQSPLLLNICGYMPMDTIIALTLGGDNLCEYSIQSILCCLPRLHRLKLDGNWMGSAIGLFRNERGPVLCPALKHLKLRDCHVELNEKNNVLPLGSRLLMMLQMRQSLDVAIDSLTMRQCTHQIDMRKELRGRVHLDCNCGLCESLPT